MFSWHFDPSVVAGLTLVAAVYGSAVILPRRATGRQIAAFVSGLAIVFVALESPLDTLGDTTSVSAHMFQHLLLALAAPPLLLYGLPEWTLRPLATLPILGAITRRLARGPIAFAIFNSIFALVHLPPFFDLTLRSNGVHIAEHLVFVAIGMLAWWPVLSPLSEAPRLSYPYQMLYLFLYTLPCSLVGALITLSGDVLYRPYAATHVPWGVSPLGDQQIGGLEMWIGGSIYYFLAFMVVWFIWASQDEPESPRLYLLKGSRGS